MLLHFKKNTRKTRPLIKHLNSMSDQIKNKVIKEYFYYCKDTYIIKYLNWRIQKLRFQKKAIDEKWYEELD